MNFLPDPWYGWTMKARRNNDCRVCGASPCYLICPTQDPFHGDQAAEHDDHELNARHDDVRERWGSSELELDEDE